MGSRVTIEKINSLIVSKNGILKYYSKEGSDSRLLITCSNGHDWWTCYRSIMNDSWCKYCANNNLLNIELAKNIAKRNSGECLSDIYKNNKTKLTWKCDVCNNMWQASLSNVKRGSWCNSCAIYKRAELKSINPCIKNKICHKCGTDKSAKEFYKRKGAKGLYPAGACIKCRRPSIRMIQNRTCKNRRKKDSKYKLRTYISTYINSALKMHSSSKAGRSCLKYLPFTIDELKQHLENQFEPWMAWNNWGTYKISEWDDINPNTWKWNIDHIIPQSKLPYDSMSHPNFIKCWSLDNLRPLNAKLNVVEGSRNES